MRRTTFLGLVLLVIGFAPRPAAAAPILGASLIATGGDVTVTYVGDFAGDRSNLFLSSVGGVELGTPFLVFSNDGTFSPGDVVTLLDATYLFDAGEELIFSLANTDEFGPGYGTYFTGPAFRNPDSHVHALVDGAPFDLAGGYPPEFFVALALAGVTSGDGNTVVGFEDRPDCFAPGVACREEIPGGPYDPAIQADFDYNDLIYAFSGVRAAEPPDPSAPEPATLFLLGAGAVGFFARRRRQQKAH